MTKSLKTEVVDFSSGILFPFYDHDSKVIFLAGKVRSNSQKKKKEKKKEIYLGEIP